MENRVKFANIRLYALNGGIKVSRKYCFPAVFILILFLATASAVRAEEDRYTIVVEESFYTVAPENREEFLRVYKTRLFPFWQEMKKMGITVDDYRMYSQRIHTVKPLWTYKTVVKFKNYAAIDRWLEIRDEVYRKLFPGESGYKDPRKIIDAISGNHWDEFIREIPLNR